MFVQYNQHPYLRIYYSVTCVLGVHLFSIYRPALPSTSYRKHRCQMFIEIEIHWTIRIASQKQSNKVKKAHIYTHSDGWNLVFSQRQHAV